MRRSSDDQRALCEPLQLLVVKRCSPPLASMVSRATSFESTKVASSTASAFDLVGDTQTTGFCLKSCVRASDDVGVQQPTHACQRGPDDWAERGAAATAARVVAASARRTKEIIVLFLMC